MISMMRAEKLLAPAWIGLGSLLGCWAATAGAATDPGAPTTQQKASGERAAPAGLDRSVLPIPEPKYPPITQLDARQAKAPPRFEVKAPAQAPNVLIVLIDDMGFGQSSAFGGPIHMPTLERMVKGGLRYNQFHTTA